MKSAPLELMREVLDTPLEDVDRFPCGWVDDVELAAASDGVLRPVALLVGTRAWAARLPALPRWLAQRCFGRAVVRVPWDAIDVIAGRVTLRHSAAQLGLEVHRRWAEALITRIPGNAKAQST
jgi:hypothetical protein